MRIREIDERIAECRANPDRDERLRCLHELYRQAGDAMVAFALGEEYEARGNHKEAADWYSTAQVRFPLSRYGRLIGTPRNTYPPLRVLWRKLQGLFTVAG